jgi:ankyrin repeat protein
MWAARNGRADAVAVLISAGARPNECERCEGGRTPLLLAAAHGHKAVVRLLRRKGSVRVPPWVTEGALLAACGRGDAEAARALCDEGADVDERDVDGSTPLLAAVQSQNFPCVQLLLKRNADLLAADCEGYTPL